MAKAETPVKEDGRKRKRGPQGPRIATIIAHVEDGKVIIDVLTFSAQSLSLLDTYADLQRRGIEPQIIRQEVLTAGGNKSDESEDSGDNVVPSFPAA